MKKLLAVALGFISLTSLAHKTDTLDVYSASMKKNIKVCVTVPDDYTKGDTRYPVVYLLHGYSGKYSEWVLRMPATPPLADLYKVIIVSPDGGYDSWYFDSPTDSTVRYETFVTKELLGYVDKNYRTKTDRKYRAISGLSMGGHGGLYLAFRHPDLYGQCGSTAGGVDFRPFPYYWNIEGRLGKRAEKPENWDKHTVLTLADKVEYGKQRIIIDCGYDDFFFQVNRDLHNKLYARHIEHEYIERPGGHNQEYWNLAILYQMLFFSLGFN